MTTTRNRGNGTIKPLPNGKFRARLSYVDGQGKRQRPSGYFDTKKEAQQWLREQLAKLDKGTFADSGRRTVGDWLTEWLTIKQPQVEPNTFLFHSSNVRLYILPAVERVPLAKLRPSHVAAMYAKLAEQGISPATRKHAGVTFSAALNDAVKMGLLATNPAKAIKKPKVSNPEIHPLDAGEVQRFLTATASDRLTALYTLAVDSGMRQGELFALHWPEVDWDAGCVSVVRSLEEKAGHHRLKDTKTGSARRRIKLSPVTLAVLNQHRQRQLAGGHYRADGLVFCDTQGGFLRKSNVYRNSFLKAVARAGLKDVRFHDLRHTCATLLLLRGVNIKAVAHRLGHAKVTTTLNTYSHFLPEMDDQAANIMEGLLGTGTDG